MNILIGLGMVFIVVGVFLVKNHEGLCEKINLD